MNKHILWMTQTAVFIALLISVQAFTGPLGQLVTGSCVNFILVTACMLSGIHAAAAVAVLSPLCAFLILGVPALPILLPFIAAGNLILVMAIHYGTGKAFLKLSKKTLLRPYMAAVCAAWLKFLVLWLGIVQITLPLIADAGQPQTGAMSALFSWPQLITALIGSCLAMTAAPVLRKAVKTSR